MKQALATQDLVKCYGRRRALDGLSVSVPAGSIFGVIGSNGAGKTTFMAVCVGLLRARSGTVNLLEQGPFDPSVHAGRVSLLPQDSRFPPHARVGELLEFYARLQGVAPAEISGEVSRVLEWTHLADRSHSPVRALSHGMNRRLAIAQAFLGSPELVFLDEPLSGLDPREAARIRTILREQRGNRTVLLSSHDLHDVQAICDQVAFIEHGRLLRQDTLDKVVRRSCSLSYVLVRGPAPLQELQQCLPDAAWTPSADGNELTVTFSGLNTADSVNAALLPVFLRHQTGILEVRRGSDLETEYLSISSGRTPPPVVPRGKNSKGE
jgi:ABC-2 type transport system ATP-binding protein